jgi:hypothetical protein
MDDSKQRHPATCGSTRAGALLMSTELAGTALLIRPCMSIEEGAGLPAPRSRPN